MFILFFYFIFSIVPTFANCPPQTDLVTVDLAKFGKKIHFCQKVENGMHIKHGPYEEFNLQGESKKKEYYLNNQVVSEEEYIKSTSEVKKTIDTDNISKQAREVINLVFQAFYAATEKPSIFMNFSHKFCIDHSQRFFISIYRGLSSGFIYKFLEGCDLQGSFQIRNGSKIQGQFNLRNVGEFTQIKFNGNYKYDSKSPKEIDLDITEAVLSGERNIEILFLVKGLMTLEIKQTDSDNPDRARIIFTKINGVEFKENKQFLLF